MPKGAIAKGSAIRMWPQIAPQQTCLDDGGRWTWVPLYSATSLSSSRPTPHIPAPPLPAVHAPTDEREMKTPAHPANNQQLSALAPALVGRYTIKREIGRGGMATVYLAEDCRHGRNVALKILRPELAASVSEERFQREIRIAAQLMHPHILQLFDSGEYDGVLFYVMPYVDGESLRDRLRREKELPIDEALEVTREILGALGYAHARGFVHRDVAHPRRPFGIGRCCHARQYQSDHPPTPEWTRHARGNGHG